MKIIHLENGKSIEVDNEETPYFIDGNNMLYVYMPNDHGYNYFPIGKVKEMEEKE